MIVGWRVAAHMRTTMVLDAIEMARWSRGIMFARLDMSLRCRVSVHLHPLRRTARRDRRFVPSIRSIGDSFDNARGDGEQLLQGRAESTDQPAAGRGRPSRMSNWPPSGGCTGTTPPACTATSTTHRQQSSKPRSTMPNGATNPWSKSNGPSLRQTRAIQIPGHAAAAAVVFRVRPTGGARCVRIDGKRSRGLTNPGSLWININRETQGPARIADDFLPGLQKTTNVDRLRWKGYLSAGSWDDADEIRHFPIRFTDIDLFDHASTAPCTGALSRTIWPRFQRALEPLRVTPT